MADKRSLSERRILITGGASGIGAATARLLAASGAKPALADCQDTVEHVAAEIGAVAIRMDVSKEDATRAGISEAVQKLGGLDGLVNAAGVTSMERFEETSLESWRRQIDINLTGVFLVCREAAPHLRKASAATIVNVASASGLRPSMAGAAYAASKAGVIMLTKAMACELGPTIRVNAVCPGVVDTPMFARHMPEHNTVFVEKHAADYVLRRIADPEEIARTILFLTMTDSSFITGSAIAVDGGRVFH